MKKMLWKTRSSEKTSPCETHAENQRGLIQRLYKSSGTIKRADTEGYTNQVSVPQREENSDIKERTQGLKGYGRRKMRATIKGARQTNVNRDTNIHPKIVKNETWRVPKSPTDHRLQYLVLGHFWCTVGRQSIPARPKRVSPLVILLVQIGVHFGVHWIERGSKIELLYKLNINIYKVDPSGC